MFLKLCTASLVLVLPMAGFQLDKPEAFSGQSVVRRVAVSPSGDVKRPTIRKAVEPNDGIHVVSEGARSERQAKHEDSFDGAAAGYMRPSHHVKQGRCDLPTYSLKSWVKEHGRIAPDHAAAFVADEETTSWKAFKLNGEREILERWGHHHVRMLPEYAQAGGHLPYMNVTTRGFPYESIREASAHWDDTKRYFNDFVCRSGLCKDIRSFFGVPRLFDGETTSTNFLIGGNQSGLPFHKHQQTWQGQVFGFKSWYIIPKGHMSDELTKRTGPYTYPVRAWANDIKALPIGQRPLYCEQAPGEIIWLPHRWWHATMNIGGFNLASGGKPGKWLKTQLHSEAEAKQLAYFSRRGDGNLFNFRGAMELAEKNKGANLDALAKPLLELRTRASEERKVRVQLAGLGSGSNKSSQIDRPFAQTASFAHCIIAEAVQNKFHGSVARSSSGAHGSEAIVLEDVTYRSVAQRVNEWLQFAADIDPDVYERQCKILNESKVSLVELHHEYVQAPSKKMPMLGFGTCCRKARNGPELEKSMLAYFKHGGRLVDTALGYGNHISVGKAIKKSGLPLEDVWITSKIDPARMGYATTLKAVDDTLAQLDVKKIDLMLIHGPNFGKETRIETWRALIEAQKRGTVSNIGVSNFNPAQIAELISATSVTPANNQIEVSPFAPKETKAMVAEFHKLGVNVTAYGSFGHSQPEKRKRKQVQQLEMKLSSLRGKYKKTVNQILLRWALDRGIAVVPGATSEDHIKENMDVTNFHLSEEDLVYLESLPAPAGWGFYHRVPGGSV